MRIVGFIHSYTTPIGIEITKDQLKRAHASRLYHESEEIHIGAVGPEPLNYPLPRVKAHHSFDIKLFEGYTLDIMYHHAKAQANTDEEVYYWYVHSKGASHSSKELAADWRNKMETCVIDNFKWCIEQLQSENVTSCGPLLHFNPHPFYAGNFWWTKASYVRRLVSPQQLIDERLSRHLSPSLVRFIHEEWITQGIVGRTIDEEMAGIVPSSRWES